MGLQSLHVAGAGLWIGTLGVTLYLTRSSVLRVDDPQLVFRYAIDTFSTLAVTVVGLLALSGVITGAIYLERIADLWATTYGQVLVLKVGLFAAIGALGAYNWRRLRPQLDHADAAPRLRRIAGFETGMGVLVLVVTAVLVVLPLGH